MKRDGAATFTDCSRSTWSLLPVHIYFVWNLVVSLKLSLRYHRQGHQKYED